MCRCRIGWWVGLPLTLMASVYETCGLQGLILLVGQAAVGVLLLETVNYIEHYGLQRTKLEAGGYVHLVTPLQGELLPDCKISTHFVMCGQWNFTWLHYSAESPNSAAKRILALLCAAQWKFSRLFWFNLHIKCILQA